MTDQGSIAEYVRRLCQGDNVQWGAVSIGKARDAATAWAPTSPTGWSTATRRTRSAGNIANLFWLLERGSRS